MTNLNRLNDLISTSRQLFSQINENKILLGILLDNIEKDIEKTRYGTFNQFLAEFGKNRKQVTDIINVSRYLTEQNLAPSDVLDVPTTIINLLYRNKVKWSEDVKHEAMTLSYTAMKDKYDSNKFAISNEVRESALK